MYLTDLRQTSEYSKFLNQIGWTVEHIDGIFFYIKRIPILGSAIKLQRTSTIPFETVEKLIKKYRVFQIIIEPINKNLTSALVANGFRITSTSYLPTKTLQIDITQSIKEINEQMKKDARYSLRKSDNQKIVVVKSIPKFRKDWFAVVGHKRHVLPLSHMQAFKKSFKDNMLLLQNADGTAGAMFLLTKDTAYYWIGYTGEDARKTLVQYQLIWNGILWAKKKKAKRFDFEGIYDPRFPHSGWMGFTHFKKGFGGKEVEYPGCFVKWRVPF